MASVLSPYFALLLLSPLLPRAHSDTPTTGTEEREQPQSEGGKLAENFLFGVVKADFMLSGLGRC